MSAPALPAAVLLDFGGVLADVTHPADGLTRLAARVHALVEASSGTPLPLARVEADVRAGWRAYGDWKRSEARRPAPREIGHQELWAELIAADWPPAGRSAVVAHATDLCADADRFTSVRPPKDGALDLLRHLRALGVRAGIVSNALSGAVSRSLVRDYGFEPLLGIQVYSDEVGMRKPHPGIFRLAADALGVELAACWYVGDTWDRDVVGGRRAGVARVILMRGSETSDDDLGTPPDHAVASPGELRALLPGLVPT